MSLLVEQRTLAQSDHDDVLVLGPSPVDHTFSLGSTDGTYKILSVRPGLTISVFDMVIGGDFAGRFATEPCIAIDVLFEASGQGWLLDAAGERLSSIPYRPGRIYIMAAPTGALGLYDVPVGTRFKGMDIRVDIGLWEKLGAGDILSTLDEHHSLHKALGEGTWVGVLPVPPQLLGAARSLFDSAMVDSDDLAFEARALDIIDAAIAAMRKTKPYSAVPPRDRRLIQRTRDLVMAELARPWTVNELAREAGLTERRLKTGFKSLYGCAVYAFLQEQRLLEARRLIEAGEINVTQAAQCVGYSNSSHFSKLFLRRFGVQPSRTRGTVAPVDACSLNRSQSDRVASQPVAEPDEMNGDGRRWREVRPGMFLGLTDLRLEQPLAYESKTFPAICLSVVLEGFATNTTEGIEAGFCPDEVWITSTGDVHPTSMIIHADHPVRVVELLLTPEWVAASDKDMEVDPIFLAMRRAMREPVMVRRRPLDARLRQIAWSALNPSLKGAFATVHLDACALTLLAILGESFQQPAEASPVMLTARSLERILEVRRHMDANPAGVVSLAALADLFAIGQSKLKQDFQRAFGISARDYLMERRLLTGRNAILRDGLSIAQAAYRAGYNHPANFTSAFTKHFGYPPSRLKT